MRAYGLRPAQTPGAAARRWTTNFPQSCDAMGPPAFRQRPSCTSSTSSAAGRPSARWPGWDNDLAAPGYRAAEMGRCGREEHVCQGRVLHGALAGAPQPYHRARSSELCPAAALGLVMSRASPATRVRRTDPPQQPKLRRVQRQPPQGQGVALAGDDLGAIVGCRAASSLVGGSTGASGAAGV